jgi:hypothetical protein
MGTYWTSLTGLLGSIVVIWDIDICKISRLGCGRYQASPVRTPFNHLLSEQEQRQDHPSSERIVEMMMLIRRSRGLKWSPSQSREQGG